MYKYEGKLNCALGYSNREKSYDAYVVGYSFIYDNTQCTITGSIINKEQNQDEITNMKNTVEAMIKSLRDAQVIKSAIIAMYNVITTGKNSFLCKKLIVGITPTINIGCF